MFTGIANPSVSGVRNKTKICRYHFYTSTQCLGMANITIFGFGLVILLFISSIQAQVDSINSINEAKCFETVEHYYSNPEVTGDNRWEYHFKNSNFKDIKFSLQCHIDNSVRVRLIEVQSVVLMLPARFEDYCVDGHQTNYEQCTSESPCSCCSQPKSTCKVVSQKNYTYCNQRQQCNLTVKSEFL